MTRYVAFALLQEMRTYLEAEAAGKAVGFELVDSRDIAHTSPPAGHWCAPGTSIRVGVTPH